MLAAPLLRYEPLGWAEEILDTATAADLPRLPRLYTAASVCSQTGRPDAAIGYAQTAVELGADPRYDPFDLGVARTWEAIAFFYCGRMEEALQVATELAEQPGLAHVAGSVAILIVLPALGRREEARAMAEETLAAARAHANPWWIPAALSGSGRAFADTDLTRALDAMRQGLDYARAHRVVLWEAILSRDLAGLEALHGDPGQALSMFAGVVDMLHRSGDVGNLTVAFADLAVLFDRLEQPDVAAILYGVVEGHGDIGWVVQLPAVVDHLRAVLGRDAFDECVAAGATMELGESVRYAQQQIQLACRKHGKLSEDS
jgi:tetratricopeptide (TPR) repeat protein